MSYLGTEAERAKVLQEDELRRSKKFRKLALKVMVVLLPLLVLSGVRVVKMVLFNRDCGDHIKRAADANTVEMAAKVSKIFQTVDNTSGD